MWDSVRIAYPLLPDSFRAPSSNLRDGPQKAEREAIPYQEGQLLPTHTSPKTQNPRKTRRNRRMEKPKQNVTVRRRAEHRRQNQDENRRRRPRRRRRKRKRRHAKQQQKSPNERPCELWCNVRTHDQRPTDNEPSHPPECNLEEAALWRSQRGIHAP